MQINYHSKIKLYNLVPTSFVYYHRKNDKVIMFFYILYLWLLILYYLRCWCYWYCFQIDLKKNVPGRFLHSGIGKLLLCKYLELEKATNVKLRNILSLKQGKQRQLLHSFHFLTRSCHL